MSGPISHRITEVCMDHRLGSRISHYAYFPKVYFGKIEDCLYDWLSVREGNSEDSPEITRVCANVLPPHVTTKGQMRIAF